MNLWLIGGYIWTEESDSYRIRQKLKSYRSKVWLLLMVGESHWLWAGVIELEQSRAEQSWNSLTGVKTLGLPQFWERLFCFQWQLIRPSFFFSPFHRVRMQWAPLIPSDKTYECFHSFYLAPLASLFAILLTFCPCSSSQVTRLESHTFLVSSQMSPPPVRCYLKQLASPQPHAIPALM